MELTALKLCWLATGDRAGVIKWLTEADGTLKVWGTAAGILICRETGIRAVRLSGMPWLGQDGGLVVADAKCLRDLGLS